MLSRLFLPARTVRTLRLRQVAFRLIRRLQPQLPKSAVTPSMTPVARVEQLRPALVQLASTLPADITRARAVAEGRFRFLNHEEHLPDIDWRARHVSHLWSYNLQYFDYALDLALAWRATGDDAFRASFQGLALDWITATDDGTGDGWQPYALSLRIINWSYALVLFGEGGVADDIDARDRILGSLHRQAEALSQRIEWHILANHLQKNLHALLVAGLLLDTEEAARWKRLALNHLWRQLDEQVLPDGGHYERSPMYHAIALGDFLEDVLLLRAVGEEAPAEALLRLRSMAGALGRLTRPDDTLHLFNDSANGIARPPSSLGRLAALVLGPAPADAATTWSLPLTGYHGATRGDARIIVDCGEPGPSYQPGHAHCDLLSFELDVAGVPLVVDSGVHGYEGDRYREFVRSTRAHNTVVIGGREQSELWSTFRMARRAEPLPAVIARSRLGWGFRGSCRPYHDRGATHQRTIELGAGAVTITDVVTGAAGQPLESFIHLHPEVRAELSGTIVTLHQDALRGEIELLGGDDVSLVKGATDPVQGWYCPEFGIARANTVVVLRVTRNAGLPFGYRISWTRHAPLALA